MHFLFMEQDDRYLSGGEEWLKATHIGLCLLMTMS